MKNVKNPNYVLLESCTLSDVVLKEIRAQSVLCSYSFSGYSVARSYKNTKWKKQLSFDIIIITLSNLEKKH